MPLTDLIRYFNTADHGGDSTLYPEDGRAAVDLGRGSLFGPARADCRATHKAYRLAYNSSSPSGAMT